jgi:uncharacterized protein (TIGR03118 family)
MKSPASFKFLTGARTAALIAIALTAALAVAPAALGQTGRYTQRNLVSDGFIPAEHVDPQLINPWGIAFNPFGFVWVSDADAMVSTLYDGDGNKQSLVVQIPSPTASTGGEPTGIVYNGSSGFVVTQNAVSGPSRFLFATEQGVIAGWAPNVDSTHAIRAINRSSLSANYKGLALSGGGNGQLLYAADFYNARIDVFDSNFQPVSLPAGAFVDPMIPSGYAPFGLQAIGGDIWVTYAKQDATRTEDVTGPGLGFVNVFNPNGKMLRRFASHGNLNAPWGLALAPMGFGGSRSTMLIGNFGDGRINSFDSRTGQFIGPLRGSNFEPIEIEGLWGLAFGNGFVHQPVDTLFFTAGPDDEEHGLYGRLDPITR